jgi:hypothetical protein
MFFVFKYELDPVSAAVQILGQTVCAKSEKNKSVGGRKLGSRSLCPVYEIISQWLQRFPFFIPKTQFIVSGFGYIAFSLNCGDGVDFYSFL